MNKLLALTFILVAMNTTNLNSQSIYMFNCKTIDGKDFSFASLKGKKLLIVNTASECGYTPQYKDLEILYEKYKSKNFIIIGFPCNDFGQQEPGSANEIKTFCTKNYGVTFPIMEKTSILNSPIYKWLTSKSENGMLDAKVNWNFNKFLIDEKGHLVKHLASAVTPMDSEIINWIEKN